MNPASAHGNGRVVRGQSPTSPLRVRWCSAPRREARPGLMLRMPQVRRARHVVRLGEMVGVRQVIRMRRRGRVLEPIVGLGADPLHLPCQAPVAHEPRGGGDDDAADPEDGEEGQHHQNHVGAAADQAALRRPEFADDDVFDQRHGGSRGRHLRRWCDLGRLVGFGLEPADVALEDDEGRVGERQGLLGRRAGGVDGDDRDVFLGLEDEAIFLALVDQVAGAGLGALLVVVRDPGAFAEGAVGGDEARVDSDFSGDLVDGVAAREVLGIDPGAGAQGGDLVGPGALDEGRFGRVDENLAGRGADRHRPPFNPVGTDPEGGHQCGEGRERQEDAEHELALQQRPDESDYLHARSIPIRPFFIRFTTG
jgi:hypothetical protein